MSNIPSTNIDVSYTENDFIYKLISPYDLAPTEDECNKFKITSLSDNHCQPSDAAFETNAKQCIKQESCKNKYLADNIKNSQINHLGSLKMMTDKTQIFDNQVEQIQNITFGIIMMAIISYQLF